MPYVKRNKEGQITAISAEQTEAIHEWVELDSPELISYLSHFGAALDVNGALAESDQALIRVLDDLVNVMVEKNLMRFTDLPEAAQQKLMERRSLRQSLNALNLFGEDEQKLI